MSNLVKRDNGTVHDVKTFGAGAVAGGGAVALILTFGLLPAAGIAVGGAVLWKVFKKKR